MKKLQLPSSYAVLSEEEQRTVSGGGELKDSLDEFLGSLHLHDFTLGEGLVSFSVTFVPMLLFTAVKNVCCLATVSTTSCWHPPFSGWAPRPRKRSSILQPSRRPIPSRCAESI